MPIVDLFSKRQKELRGEVPEVYDYENLPRPLRVQIVQIWWSTLGSQADFTSHHTVRQLYAEIVKTLCHEYGCFELPRPNKHYGQSNYFSELADFFLHESNVEKALDAVELSFQRIDRSTRNFRYLGRDDASKRADTAIEELNCRFKEHGVGYQFTNGRIIRIDSELIHSEIVKPALALLHEQHYAGAQEEFLKAHKYYRNGDAKGALSECLKAFESVMKAICNKRGWHYSADATSKPLIKVCFDNGLIPPYWESHYSSLRSLLESGVPTGRNKLGGHGQGTNPVSVPYHLVAYMLHMTASAMVFLIEGEKQLP